MAFTKINAAGIGTTETVTVDGLTVINDGSFGGNLTVSGVLTYEDVTNVDSVGLITARNGIEIGARPGVAASISVDGNAIFSGITTIGGNVKVGTGVTLSPDGDKSQILRDCEPQDTLHFYGDKLLEGENDYPLGQAITEKNWGIVHMVTDFHDTWNQLK